MKNMKISFITMIIALLIFTYQFGKWMQTPPDVKMLKGNFTLLTTHTPEEINQDHKEQKQTIYFTTGVFFRTSYRCRVNTDFAFAHTHNTVQIPAELCTRITP